MLGVFSGSWIPDHDDGRAQEQGVHQWQNVHRQHDVKAGSCERELTLATGPSNTTKLTLAHGQDFHVWPTCQGVPESGYVGLDVRQDPI